MDTMFPDDMGIGEDDNTVQLVLIYSSIAILYLVVAYIMFFRSFFLGLDFFWLLLPSQILFRKRPNEKEDPKEGEAKKSEEPKKDKKMKKKDWICKNKSIKLDIHHVGHVLEINIKHWQTIMFSVSDQKCGCGRQWLSFSCLFTWTPNQ